MKVYIVVQRVIEEGMEILAIKDSLIKAENYIKENNFHDSMGYEYYDIED